MGKAGEFAIPARNRSAGIGNYTDRPLPLAPPSRSTFVFVTSLSPPPKSNSFKIVSNMEAVRHLQKVG